MSSLIFRRVLLFLVLLTALRWAYVGRVELSPDETYYQMWSERLDWGYYSKGPGIAAVIRAGTTLFGVNEFGVRFFAPVCALLTSLLLFGFARRLYGESAAAWTVLLINVTPLFQAGALLMTIDAPFILCWTAAMVACWRALESGSGVFWWMLTGVCIGLGYLCKYTCAMELLCVVLALAAVPGWRGEFRRPGFWLMLILAVAVGSPPMIWNASHAWITLDHLRARGSLDNSNFIEPHKEFGEFLGGQFGAYSPLIFGGLLVAVVWGWRRGKCFRSRTATAAPERLDDEAEKARFLLAFGLPLLVMYGLLAFKTSGEPNWTGPAFVALSVLGVALWRERALVSKGAARFCVAALMVALLMSALVLGTDALRPLTAAAGFPWPYKADPTARLKGWRSTAEAVANARQEAERELGAPVFLIANRYQLASELNFYLPERRTERPGDPLVYMPESQSIETQFSLWPGYDQFDAPPGATTSGAPAPKTAEEEFKQVGANPLVGRSALFITDNERDRRVPSSIESGFEETRLIAQYEIRRGGLPLRRLRVYACFNYKGLEL